MKRQTTRHIGHITAALTALALLAGYAAMGNTASAQSFNEALMEYILANQPTTAKCEAAWASSPAYTLCGNRFPETAGADNESVVADGFICVVDTFCRYIPENADEERGRGAATAISAHWFGPLDWLPNLQNCDGELKRVC